MSERTAVGIQISDTGLSRAELRRTTGRQIEVVSVEHVTADASATGRNESVNQAAPHVAGLSGPDVGDNALGDVVYHTGRHTAPLQKGDTVFAATEILDKQDYPGRPDLGIAQTRLFGHKFLPEEGATHEDAPAGFKKVQIFELDRDIAVKRRSHYS